MARSTKGKNPPFWSEKLGFWIHGTEAWGVFSGPTPRGGVCDPPSLLAPRREAPKKKICLRRAAPKKIFPSGAQRRKFFFGFSDICEQEEGGGGLGPPLPPGTSARSAGKKILPSARSAEKNFPSGAQRRNFFFPGFQIFGNERRGGWSGPPLDPRGGGGPRPPPPPCTFFRSHKALPGELPGAKKF